MAHILKDESNIEGVRDEKLSVAFEDQINERLAKNGVSFGERYAIGATWNDKATNAEINALSDSIAIAIAAKFKESYVPNKMFTPAKVNLTTDTTGTKIMEVTFYGPAMSEQNL